MESVLTGDSENVFFRCVEDCSEAIMITDSTGKLLYVNPAWCQIYGYSSQEALGSTPRLLHSGNQKSEFYERMWSEILNPKLGHWKGEVVNKSKDGTLIPVLLTITPVRDKSGSIVGHMGIALDISTQKQLEAKVLQQDRLASIGVLASGLAHEVGTPLGVVRGRAEFLMMQTDAKQNKTIESGLQTIITQIDRISRLISSLLRFSRANDDVRTQEIELTLVVEEVLNLIGQNLKANSIELRLEVPSGLRIHADTNRLQQVFLNLLVNAVQAIQKAVRDGSRRGHHISIRAEEKRRSGGLGVAISITDTGCGIPPENMRKLFQPFFTTKDVGEGTGLGLAIVSKLIHEMRGEITVESAPNDGAKFTIFLPAPAHLR